MGVQMARSPKTRNQLLEHLDDQIGFLERSNQMFDNGYTNEALRLATVLRVLFHQAKRSQALIWQLGLENTLTWVDTAGMPYSDNEATTHNLTHIKFSVGPDDGTVEYVAKLDNYPPSPILTKGGPYLPRGSRIPLDEWWTNTVVKDLNGTELSRRALVLALSNKEGGAHVDPDGDAAYDALTKSNSLGWGIVVGQERKPASQNPVFASVRQISYEVVESVRQQQDRIG